MKESEFREKVMPLFGISIFLMAIGSIISTAISYANENVVIGSYIVYGLILLSIFLMKRKRPWNVALFFAFSFATGLIVSPILFVIFGFRQVFFSEATLVSSLFILSLSLYSIVSKKDFRTIGGMIIAINIGLIVASLINIFIVHVLYDLIVDVVAILLSLAMVLLDMSRIIRDYNDDDYITAAISIYTDFLKFLWRIITLGINFFTGLFKK